MSNAHPIFHSDRGFQYTNRYFYQRLVNAGMTQSMSRVGRCIDNGPMEGFWGTRFHRGLTKCQVEAKRNTNGINVDKLSTLILGVPFSLHGFPAPFRRRFPALPFWGHGRVSHADGLSVFKVRC